MNIRKRIVGVVLVTIPLTLGIAILGAEVGYNPAPKELVVPPPEGLSQEVQEVVEFKSVNREVRLEDSEVVIPTPMATIPIPTAREYPGWPDWVEYRWMVIPRVGLAKVVQPLEICQNEDIPSCWNRQDLYQEPNHADPWQLQNHTRVTYIHRGNWRAEDLRVGDYVFLYENILPYEEELPLHQLKVAEVTIILAEAEEDIWEAVGEGEFAIITCHPNSGDPTHRLVFWLEEL